MKTLKFKLVGVIGFCILSIIGILILSSATLVEIEGRFKSMKREALDGQVASLAITRDINYVSRLTRNIMLGSDIDKDLGKLDKRIERIEKNFKILEDSAINQEERGFIEKARTAALGFVEDGRRFARALRDLPKSERYTKYPDYGRSATPLAQKSRKYFGTLVKQKDAQYAHCVTSFEAELSTARWTVLIVASCVAAIMLILSLLLLRAILKPLGEATEFTRRLASGDYEAEVKAENFHGEIRVMVEALQEMAANLKVSMAEATEQAERAREQAESAERAREQADGESARVTTLMTEMTEVARKATEIAEQLHTESGNLSGQVKEISSGASLQRDRVQETASAMEEMNATVSEVASNATNAVEEADSARSKAQEGSQIVHQVVEATAEVSTQVDSMKTAFDDLGRRVDEIGQIMSVITDIADQTNLLALNAAIEAARAGDAGRGFAVVADEVRKLAEKTMQATKEVGDSVTGIQTGASSNMVAIDKVAQAVSKSTGLTSEAGESLNQIVRIVTDTADRIQSIATAAEQQSAASEEITRNTTDVNRVASETFENVNRSVESIENVAELAEELNGIMRQLDEGRR